MLETHLPATSDLQIWIQAVVREALASALPMQAPPAPTLIQILRLLRKTVNIPALVGCHHPSSLADTTLLIPPTRMKRSCRTRILAWMSPQQYPSCQPHNVQIILRWTYCWNHKESLYLIPGLCTTCTQSGYLPITLHITCRSFASHWNERRTTNSGQNTPGSPLCQNVTNSLSHTCSIKDMTIAEVWRRVQR